MKRRIILSVAAFILAGLILAPLGLTLISEYWYLYLIVALAVGVFTFFVLSFHDTNSVSIQKTQKQTVNDVLLKIDSLQEDIKAVGDNLRAVMEKNRQDILQGIAENLSALKETFESVSESIKRVVTSTDEMMKSAVNSVNGRFDEAFDKSDKGVALLQENLKIIDEGLRSAIDKNLHTIQEGNSKNMETLHNVTMSVNESIKRVVTSTDEMMKSAVNSVNGRFDEAFDKSDKGVALLQENLKIIDEGLRSAIDKNLHTIQEGNSKNMETLHNVTMSVNEEIKALQDFVREVSKNSNDDLLAKFESAQRRVEELKDTLELLTTENYQEILNTEDSLLSVLTAMNGELNKLSDIQTCL